MSTVPVAASVIAAQRALADKPELLNQDPYGAGMAVSPRSRRAPARRRVADERQRDYAQFLTEEAK